MLVCKPKNTLRIKDGLSSYFFYRNTLNGSYFLRHVFNVARFVALAAMRDRRGKGGVGFDEHFVERAETDRVVVHVGVGNRPRERQITAEVEIFLCQLSRTGKEIYYRHTVCD